jgi:hypothetical protein
MSETNNEYILARLVNYNSSAEGSVLPPAQKGEFRVPFVSALQVTRTQYLLGQTIFTLAWKDPTEDATVRVDHYNIYYQYGLNDNAQPVGPYTSGGSPAVIMVPATGATGVTFYVQTVLTNGMTSPLLRCPTTAGFTGAPEIDVTIPPGSITALELADNSIIMSKFATGIRPPVIVTSLPISAAAYPAGSTVVLTTDRKLYRSTGDDSGGAATLWTTAVDGADIVANSIVAGHLSAGAVNTAALAAAAVDATKVNLKQIIVNGLTLGTSGSNVTWSACTVYFDGAAYSISSGATTGGNKFIYWVVGSGSFTEAGSFTPGSSVFLIATNTSGTPDVAWNKLAYSSIQESNLAFSILVGFQPRTSTLTALQQNTNVTDFSWPLIAYTGSGALLTLGVMRQAVTGIGTSNFGAVDMEIIVDGAPAQTIRFIDGPGANQNLWNATTVSVSQNASGNASSPGNILNTYIGLGFKSSLYVNVIMRGNGPPLGSPPALTLDATATWATKT